MSPRKSSRRSEHRTRHGRPTGGRDPSQASGRSHGIRKFKGTIDKNHKGFAFVILENAGEGRGHEDIFIPPRDAQKYFHGDRVSLTLSGQNEILELKVIEHRFRELVGRFEPHPVKPESSGWVIYERRRAREEVFIPSLTATEPKLIRPLALIKQGDWVRARLTFHPTGPYPVTGEITQVFGETLPASADIGMIAAEYSLVEHHSDASEAEARLLPATPDPADFSGRADLRHIPFITIDGETARDFDDAVFVERERSGYALWVAIADVSHYVRSGSSIDTDARSRGTSVYFPERAFHMLPRTLSEHLCSLKPAEPRLSMAVRVTFDRNGVPGEIKLFNAIIESRRRATYTEIAREWDQNQKNPQWEYAPHFGLYQALRKTRLERGSIDFDLPEPEVLVDDSGEVLSITQRPRNDAHRLIEEFMIAANEAVTRWIMERHWPFIFRIHEDPAAESLEAFRSVAASVGVRITGKEVSSQKFMAEVIRRLEGHPAQALLNMAFLRSLKRAVYSSTHGPHYGLASEAYTHFTSPIRRYPDLVVHRMLRLALDAEQAGRPSPKGGPRDKFERDLAETAEHCSYRERIAADAERDSIKLKQVRAMLSKIGSEFEGRITGFVPTGMFVQIGEPYCEGIIPRDTMTDDFYEFNEERMIFYGRRKKVTFKIGDPIMITVVRADIEKRQIEFGRVLA